MAQPLLAVLSRQGFQIDVLATPWVAPIFETCAEVHQVIQADFKHGALGLGLRIKIAKNLRQAAYDQAYVLPNSWKSALIPWLAKIPQRIGYKGEMRFGLLNLTLNNPPKIDRPSMVEHYAKLAQFNLASKDRGEISSIENPALRISDEARGLAQSQIRDFFPESEIFFVLAPGAEYGPAKQWPLSHFAALGKRILLEYPKAGILIIGGPKDRTAGQSIQDEVTQTSPRGLSANRIKSICGELTLAQSIALLGNAAGVVSNDSGMMHVAAALGIPQVAMFGSSDPKHTPPLSPFAAPIWLGLDCSPCHQRQCPLGHLKCLQDISPETAFKELSIKIIKKKG